MGKVFGFGLNDEDVAIKRDANIGFKRDGERGRWISLDAHLRDRAAPKGLN
jgi:hypothetical protein